MKTIKGWIATTVILATLAMSATSANAGIIIAGATDTPTDPCTETTTKTTDSFKGGIIIAGIAGTGIIIAGLTGIIIAGVTSDEPTNCGIIIAG